jgi:hypothetical protein
MCVIALYGSSVGEETSMHKDPADTFDATRGWRVGGVAFAVLGLMARAPKLSDARSEFETPPVLKASDLAPTELLKGPRFVRATRNS